MSSRTENLEDHQRASEEAIIFHTYPVLLEVINYGWTEAECRSLFLQKSVRILFSFTSFEIHEGRGYGYLGNGTRSV